MKLYYYLFIVSLFFLISCSNDSPTAPIANEIENGKIIYKIFPDIGTVGTEFKLTIDYMNINGDIIENNKNTTISVDWNNDDVIDYKESRSNEISFILDKPGKQKIKFNIRNKNNEYISDSCYVYIQELKNMIPNRQNVYVFGNVDYSIYGNNKFVFDGSEEGFFHNIYMYDTITDNLSRLTSYPENCAHHADLSPDGSKAVFYQDRKMRIVNVETKEIITPFKDLFEYPPDFRWSPNGNNILFTWDKDDKFGIWNYNLESDTTTFFMEGFISYCWNLTGDKIAIYYKNNRNKLTIINYPSKTVYKEYEISYGGSKLDWSANDKYLSLGWNYKKECYQFFEFTTQKVYTFKPQMVDVDDIYSFSSDVNLFTFAGQLNEDDKWEIWSIEFPEDLE